MGRIGLIPIQQSSEEIQSLKDLLEQWRYHAEQCDTIQNRPMAEWQKKRDLIRVSAFKKILAQLDQ